MKKLIMLISILALGVSVQAARKTPSTQRRYISPDEVHVTVSPASRQKADALYESVRKAYSQGRLSADGVVDKALYHKVWNDELAARCLQLVADRNNRAKAELGYLYTFYKTRYKFPGKTSEGVRLLEESAKSGNKTASDYLGIYYSNQKDYDKAWRYFKAAGPDNIPFALTVMGEMCEKGQGVKKDYAKAREYFRRASELGDAHGASDYGMALQRKWYGDVDMPDAFFWTYVSGDLGCDAARSHLQLPLRGERFGDDKNTASVRNAFTLGDAWNDLKGHPLKDEPIYQQGYKGSLIYRQIAAERGDEWSLFFLGSMSYNDEFLNHSGDFISKCYEPVIAGGHLPKPALALVYERMADLYRRGDGVKANSAKADSYTRKAAELGSLAAYKIVEKIPD